MTTEIDYVLDWVESLDRYESAIHREELRRKLEELWRSARDDGYMTRAGEEGFD
jgi:hypothetical protein